jgi:hypothetical protein
MTVVLSPATLDTIPVDFLADPDGAWEYETLTRQAGFDDERGQISVGALTRPFAGFPEGAAVVALMNGTQWSVALVDTTASSGLLS